MSTPSVAAGHGGPLEPSPWIARFAPLAVEGGCVLDVASGRGRHSLFFAARGHPVVAVDRDPSALAALASAVGVRTICADLETGDWPLGAERFDVVVVTNYLHRALLPRLLRGVAPDGLLLYETFAAGNEAFGKPSNPDFLLNEGELLAAVDDHLIVVAFEQGAVAAARPAVLQRLAAVGRGRHWPPALPP